ncbi:unnamed protein product [Cuscuta europaea]|uniref:Uncharacterized protein n=1 Tax=Cuscuta europaea TaxID=41803 RepID=A0A9P0ZBE1_CUSEU|nr:unnamed protein product [Cuscuta europaea]
MASSFQAIIPTKFEFSSIGKNAHPRLDLLLLEACPTVSLGQKFITRGSSWRQVKTFQLNPKNVASKEFHQIPFPYFLLHISFAHPLYASTLCICSLHLRET